MELFGYEEGSQRDRPMRLSEVSMSVSPSELRLIAGTLERLATEMEDAGFGHVHLADRLSALSDGPDLIVVKAVE